jgi:hypothetical protein
MFKDRRTATVLLSLGLVASTAAGCHRHVLSREEALRQIQIAAAKRVEEIHSAIEISNREIKVTGLVLESPNAWADFSDSFDWEKKTEDMSLHELSESFSGKGKQHINQTGRAHFQLYDDGWRLVSVDPRQLP